MRRQALLLVLVLGVLCLFYASPASASKRLILAQDPSPAASAEGGDKDASQSDAADEPAPAEEEAGPVWTYQMSKIVIGLLVLMALGIGGAYYKIVAKRQKEGF